jgi:predicted DNA-binding antitoxin AbrB/MazE fold protein
MTNPFEAVYENGVFRPLEPLPLTDGLKVSLTLGPAKTPLTPEQAQALMRLGHAIFEGFSDEELSELEADILGARGSQEAAKDPR